jgi:hypothetical protein
VGSSLRLQEQQFRQDHPPSSFFEALQLPLEQLTDHTLSKLDPTVLAFYWQPSSSPQQASMEP